MQNQGDASRISPSLRNYRVSALIRSTQEDNNKNSLPIIKIKNRLDGIVIPSVPKSEEYSPRSLDSRSLENGSITSNISRVNSRQGFRSESRSGNAANRRSSFKHPVKVSSQGGINVTVENSKFSNDLPSTKLDILETFLPKDLRNPNKFKSKMHEKIRATQNVENNTNLISKMFHDERIVSDDYHPVHYSSGAISISSANRTMRDGALTAPRTADSVTNGVPPPLSGIIQHTLPLNQRRENKGSLWDSDGQNDLIVAREERNNMQYFMDDLARSLKEHQEAEAIKQQEEREIILKLKVVNTLFNQKVTFTDALVAAAKRASSATTRKDEIVEKDEEKSREENQQTKLEEQNAIMDAITRSMELEALNNPTFKTADFLEFSDDDDDDEDEYLDSPLEGEDLEDAKYQRKIRKRMIKRAMMTQVSDSTRSDKIMGVIADMSTRKMKEKLRNLAKYINSHTSRKIINAWNGIEGRFKASTYSKTVMTLNTNGLTHPVKHPAIFVSTLVGLLCSSKIKIGYQELTVVLERLGFSDEEIFHARKIAALNLVISYDNESKTKQTLQYKIDLQVLMRAEERLISIDELINIVFPADPVDREQEFERLRSNRQAETQLMMDEKKKKDESKEKMELRRRKLMSDFETTLEQVQLFKGEYTRERHNDFAFLITYCKRTIEQYYEDVTAKISPEIMSYIGMDAFPPAVRDKVKNKKKSGMILAINGGVNPFMKKPKPIIIQSASNLKDDLPHSGLSPTGDRIDGKRPASRATRVGGGSGGSTSTSVSGVSTPGYRAAMPAPVVSPHNRQTKILAPSAHASIPITAKGVAGGSNLETIKSPSASAEFAASGVSRPTTGKMTDAKQKLRSPTTVEGLSSSGKTHSHTRHRSPTSVLPSSNSNRKSLRIDEKEATGSTESKVTSPTAEDVFALPPKPSVPPRQRIDLAGPPRVMQVLREVVSFGKGLSGYPYRDVVAMLQYIAVMKLQAIARCFMRRWRFSAARRKWRHIFLTLKTNHYLAWKVVTKHNQETREFCWRKLKAWNFYLRRCKYRRNLFRQCFWPFYTWRKYSDASATAREKAHFLVHRVMPTVLTIRVFKAWKGYAKNEVRLNRLADSNHQRLIKKEIRGSFLFLHDWARRRRFIRKAWFRKGASMRKINLFINKQIPFQTWLTYMKYRKFVRNKLKIQLFGYMLQMYGKKVWHLRSLSNAERRMLTSTKRGKKRPVSKVGLKKSKSGSKPGSSASSRKTPSSSRRGSRSGSIGKFGEKSIDESATTATSVTAGDTRSDTGDDRTMDDSDGNTDLSDTGGSPLKSSNKGKEKVMHFNWKKNITPFFDIDSDGEDIEDIPDKLTTLYKNAVAAKYPIPAPQTFPYIETAPLCVVERAEKFHEVYQYVDIWNCFEAACRFHRMGSRAFNNLRHYARIKRHVRKYLYRTRMETKKLFFCLLKSNAKMMLRRNSATATNQTLAETLQNAVRTHTIGKLVRIRKATAQVNLVLGRDYDVENVDEEQRAIDRIKNLNLIDDDNDDDFQAKERERRKAKQLELKLKDEMMRKNSNLPNLLEWDRGDRDIEEDLAIKMVQFGKSIHKTSLERAADADMRSLDIVTKENKHAKVVSEVFALEKDITDTAITAQEAYISKFRIHAADNLITILAKIYVAVQVSMLKEESKLYFRALRIPMLLTRSRSMYRRKKLMNWIRICQRLNSISRHADYYAKKRTMWCSLNRWLKYVEVEKLNPTPGIVLRIRRKVLLHPDYSEMLQRHGFKKLVYLNNDRLRAASSDFDSLFRRWKSYTQESILFRIMYDKVWDLFVLSLKQKCFYAMKTAMKLKDILVLIKLDKPSFPIVRIKADLAQICKKFLSMRKKSLVSVIGKYNRKFISKMKSDGKAALSFKKFMIAFENETSTRISTEQRILSESFEARGKQEFFDVRAPNKGDPILPAIMTKMDGKAFSDPHSISSDGRENAIPGGFKLSKLKFVLQQNVGIIGWQCIWSADGARDIEAPHRGLWNAAAMTIHEFSIPKEDFLAGIEYLYDGVTIVGVRLKLLFKGLTGWIGGKTSMSTLSVSLGTEIAPKLIFEAEADKYLDADERENPAMPSNFIIGLTGIVCNGRATCLGIVVRKIKKQNIFSYYYVQDVIDRMQFERSEFGVAGSQVLTIDAGSVPSQVSGENSHNLPVQDSLTMSMQLGLESTDTFEEATHGSLSHSNGNDDEMSLDSMDSDTSATMDESEADDKEQPRLNGAQRMLNQRAIKRRVGLMKKEHVENSPLTSSEEQFFDVLRMRTTELSAAVDRVVEFAKRLWTDKDIRLDPILGNLVGIRIVSQMAKWYFNTLSKRLIKSSPTEKRGLILLKSAKQFQYQSIKLTKRSQALAKVARNLERAPQTWTNKSMLGPAERQNRKDYLAKVQSFKDMAAAAHAEAEELRYKVVEYEKNGYALLPRIALSQYVMGNYKIKIAAARHKASLLERMTLDEIKTGLFGTNTKENLLNRDQMQAIHHSLKNQKIKPKDTLSLDRLIEDVIAEESAEIAARENVGRRGMIGVGRPTRSSFIRSTLRETSISTASQTLSLGSGPAVSPLQLMQLQIQQRANGKINTTIPLMNTTSNTASPIASNRKGSLNRARVFSDTMTDTSAGEDALDTEGGKAPRHKATPNSTTRNQNNSTYNGGSRGSVSAKTSTPKIQLSASMSSLSVKK